jgi:hypothetical protein
MGTVLHFRTIRLQSRGFKQIQYGKVKVETAGKASLGCGQLSVGGEITNRVTIKEPCYQRQCG